MIKSEWNEETDKILIFKDEAEHGLAKLLKEGKKIKHFEFCGRIVHKESVHFIMKKN